MTWIAPLVEHQARRLVRRGPTTCGAKAPASCARDGGSFDDWAAQFYDGWMSAAGEDRRRRWQPRPGRQDAARRRQPTVTGALWERTKRSLAQVRMVVDECGAVGERAEDALERYADTIEEAGAQTLAASLMAVLVEVGGHMPHGIERRLRRRSTGGAQGRRHHAHHRGSCGGVRSLSSSCGDFRGDCAGRIRRQHRGRRRCAGALQPRSELCAGPLRNGTLRLAEDEVGLRRWSSSRPTRSRRATW